MFTVGVDEQDGNIFDNEDADDWVLATKELLFYIKIILINGSVYKYINLLK